MAAPSPFLPIDFEEALRAATQRALGPGTPKPLAESIRYSLLAPGKRVRPRLTIAVVLDEPMGGAYAGGSVAAPVFRRVGEMALRYLGVTPRGSVPVKLSEVSEQSSGDLAANTYQVLSEQRAVAAPVSTAVVTPSAPLRNGELRVPDLTGLPQREAS